MNPKFQEIQTTTARLSRKKERQLLLNCRPTSILASERQLVYALAPDAVGSADHESALIQQLLVGSAKGFELGCVEANE